MLENSKEKIACIVNDVASINIDAKLVRNDRNRTREQDVNTTTDLADTVELQNGCACKCARRCRLALCVCVPAFCCFCPGF